MTQDDVLFPQLTVEETLLFSAFLRLPSNMNRQQKYERVDMIVKELGLERCGVRWGIASGVVLFIDNYFDFASFN